MSRKWKVIVSVITIIILIIIGLFVWFKSSPYLSSMLIRSSFEKGGEATNLILEKYAPNNIASLKDIQYRENDPDAFIDIYYTNIERSNAPTIVWIHGGGWLAGNKNDLSPWARILSGEGFNVVALNYSLAPEKKYPLPIIQTNEALGYLSDNADHLNINIDKLVIGGDSAGAQLAAQAALIETNPDYSMGIGIEASLAGKISALLLNCGPYDLSLVNPSSNSDGAKLVRTFMWSYTGNKDFYNMDGSEYFSISPHVTSDFPPSFITAGNKDPLLQHSEKLAESLQNAGVETDLLFYPADYAKNLNHEYQFNLDTEDGKNALDRMIKFSRQYTEN